MKTKQEYIDTLVCIIKEYYSTIRSPEETNKFNSYFRLFKELIDEHFKEKPETNFEHYFEHLSKLNMGDFALINGRVTKCSITQCSECDFNGDCIEGKFRWLKQPYEKLPYKLSQWEYDLLNAYKDSGMQKCLSNYRPLLELNEKGHFKGIGTSTPIHEILDNCKVV